VQNLPPASAVVARSAPLWTPPVTSAAPVRRARPNLLRESVLLLSLFLIYRFGRALISGHVQAAMVNASEVWELERLLRMPSELAFQQWALRWPDLIEAANWYYVGVHFPITGAFLAWGWWRRPPAEYRWARRLIITMTALAFLIHTAMPLAPQRMMDRLGFVDTMAIIGPSAYDGSAATIANQFAAMPSLHVGWALLISVVVIRTTRSRWRWVTVAHPAITTLVVVVTANHYWLDALVAAALLGVTLAITPRPAREDAAEPQRQADMDMSSTAVPVGSSEPSLGSIVTPRLSPGPTSSTSSSTWEDVPRPRTATERAPDSFITQS
jgi:hypothetical protein